MLVVIPPLLAQLVLAEMIWYVCSAWRVCVFAAMTADKITTLQAYPEP